jgi:hypothetical protein
MTVAMILLVAITPGAMQLAVIPKWPEILRQIPRVTGDSGLSRAVPVDQAGDIGIASLPIHRPVSIIQDIGCTAIVVETELGRPDLRR